MKNWKGKPFLDWCLSDINDERKINYNLYNKSKNESMCFTSEEELDKSVIRKIQESIIENIKLEKNEWYVELIDYQMQL